MFRPQQIYHQIVKIDLLATFVEIFPRLFKNNPPLRIHLVKAGAPQHGGKQGNTAIDVIRMNPRMETGGFNIR